MNNIGWIIVVFIIWFIKHEQIMPGILEKLYIKESILEYAKRTEVR